MNFLYPAFLYGLFALLIPLIIHLFHFRRYKTVMFTNVRFLKEVKQQTATRSNLKRILILISRLLAVLFLVLAFSQPIIPPKNVKEIKPQEAISIYIDNSFSMNALGENGTLFDEAKEIARGIIAAHNAIHKVQLLTNDFEGKHQHLVDKDLFLSNLDEIKISSSVRNLSSVLNRQSQALSMSGEEDGITYIISDFQKNITDIETMDLNSSSNAYFIPVRHANQGNIFIDSCWFDEPVLKANHPINLVVRIKKTSDEDVESIQLTLKINDQIKSLSPMEMVDINSALDTLSFTINSNGWQKCMVYINDHPITFDDEYYFAFEILPEVGVLAINEGDEVNGPNDGKYPASITYLRAVYKSDPYFRFSEQSSTQLSYGSFAQNKLIILNELIKVSSGMASELTKYIEQGGDILIFPNREIDFDSYKSFLSGLNTDFYTSLSERERSIDKINIQSDIFSDVFDMLPKNLDLPFVKKGYILSDRTRTNEEPLLQFKDGSSFIAKYSYKNGNIYVCTVPLNPDFSNLTSHAIFHTLIYKIALLSNDPKPHTYVIGKNKAVVIDQQDINVDEIIKMKKEKYEFIPSQKTVAGKTKLFMHDMIQDDGIYDIVKGSNGDLIGHAAMNYNRLESELNFFTPTELTEIARGKGIQVLKVFDKDIKQFIAGVNQGKPLWKLCIIFVLIFLAVEIILIKLLN